MRGEQEKRGKILKEMREREKIRDSREIDEKFVRNGMKGEECNE